ncbi:MAG TPA: hypothetical protein HPP94_17185 [Desulfuromonadales bacterium]|nr:hypothetical protein [Desulfuromonadales bacterium]
MKKLATLTMTLLAMTLLLSSVKDSVAAPATVTTDQTSVQERKDARKLVNRNAAAKKLKAELDAKNAAQSRKATTTVK